MVPIVLIGIMCSCLLSCGMSSPVGPESLQIKEPGLGSVFTYVIQQINKDNFIVPGTDKYYVETVVAIDTIISGKQGVYIIKSEYPDSLNGPNSVLNYYGIDNNQDLLWRYDGGGNYTWIRIPITSLAETRDTAYGMIDYQLGKKADLRSIYTYTYLGDQTIMIDTMSVITRKFRSVINYTLTFNGVELYKGMSEATMLYAPYLGMLAQSTTPAMFESSSNTWSNGLQTTLKSFVLD